VKVREPDETKDSKAHNTEPKLGFRQTTEKRAQLQNDRSGRAWELKTEELREAVLQKPFSRNEY